MDGHAPPPMPRSLERLMTEEDSDMAPAGISRFYRRLSPRTRFFGLAILFAIIATAIYSYGEKSLSTPFVTGADHQNSIQTGFGASLYMPYCQSCHGADLAGQPDWDANYPTGNRPAVPLAGDSPIWRLSDQGIFQVIKYGGQASSPAEYQNNMPAYGDSLSDGNIWALVAFIKSRWTGALHQRQKTSAEPN